MVTSIKALDWMERSGRQPHRGDRGEVIDVGHVDDEEAVLAVVLDQGDERDAGA